MIVKDRKIDIGKALELRLVHNYSYQQIADYFKVSRAAVFQALSKLLKLLEDRQLIDTYVKYKTDLLTSAELKILNAIVDDKKIDKASINNLAYTFQQIYNANRLESGKSTQNISYADATARLRELEEEERKIQEELMKLERQD